MFIIIIKYYLFTEYYFIKVVYSEIFIYLNKKYFNIYYYIKNRIYLFIIIIIFLL